MRLPKLNRKDIYWLVGVLLVAISLFIYQQQIAINQQKAVEYFERGEYRKAYAGLKRATHQDANNSIALLQFAKTSYELRRFAEAEKAYQIVLDKGGNTAAAYTGLGKTAVKRGDRKQRFSRAEDFFKKAIQAGPGYEPAYVAFGVLLIAADKKDEARKIIAEGLKYNADSSALQNLLKSLE